MTMPICILRLMGANTALIAAISCYREKLLDKLGAFSTDRNWEDFLEDAFAYLKTRRQIRPCGDALSR